MLIVLLGSPPLHGCTKRSEACDFFSSNQLSRCKLRRSPSLNVPSPHWPSTRIAKQVHNLADSCRSRSVIQPALLCLGTLDLLQSYSSGMKSMRRSRAQLRTVWRETSNLMGELAAIISPALDISWLAFGLCGCQSPEPESI